MTIAKIDPGSVGGPPPKAPLPSKVTHIKVTTTPALVLGQYLQQCANAKFRKDRGIIFHRYKYTGHNDAAALQVYK